MTSFTSFALPAPVLAELTASGKTEAFPIQSATLPDTLAGRDVLGRGRTGSGKTLAFSLPMVTRLAGGRRRPGRPRGLVLVPTRELANQVEETLAPIAKSMGLRTTTIFGGVSQARQERALSAGVDVVVACPGRLEDLLGQRILTLDDVEITVLDEADHMADLGFLPGVKRIMDRTPATGQRMLFSATLDNGVDVLVKRYLNDPLRHSVDSAESPVAAMTHHVLMLTGTEDKKRIVNELASGSAKRLLFTRTKHQAKKLAKQLTASGIPAVDLHGNLSQPARERNLAAFHGGGARVMVATDIAARGIHVDDVELVVHVDPPAEHKAYLHRSGRTARAGSAGDVVTLVLPEQAADMKVLARRAKISVAPQRIRPGDEYLRPLVGEVAPYVAPQPAPAPQPGGRGRGGGRGNGGSATRGGNGGRGRGGAQGSGDAARGAGGRGGRSGTQPGGLEARRTAPGNPVSRTGAPGSAPGGSRGGRRRRSRGRRPTTA